MSVGNVYVNELWWNTKYFLQFITYWKKNICGTKQQHDNKNNVHRVIVKK